MFRVLLLLLVAGAASAQTPDSALLDLSHAEDGTLLDCAGSAKRKIQKDFKLPGRSTTTYRIAVLEDSISLLFFRKDDTWMLLDTISSYTSFNGYLSCEFDYPYARFTDFNEDGHCDLEIGISTNVNGNNWVKLFIYNKKTDRIEILRNRAEENDIWDAPVFAAKNSTISCYRVAGLFGLSFESKYKLNGLVAYPVSKKEYDTSGVDTRSGRGAVYTYYTGYNQRWKAARRVVYRMH